MLRATREQFESFLKIRNAGMINMRDIRLGINYSGVPSPVYEDILGNFKAYCKKYPELFIKY